MSTPALELSGEDVKRRGSFFSDVGLLIRLAWDFSPRAMALQTVLLLLSGVAGGVSLLLLIPIVNSVAQSGSATTVPVLGDIDLSGYPLPLLLSAFVAVVAVTSVITWWSSVNSTVLQQTVVDVMRQNAFDAILSAKWEFTLSRRNSDVIELVTSGAGRSGMAFVQLLKFLVTSILFLATAVVALIVSPLVTGLALVGIFFLGGVQWSAVSVSHRLGRSFGTKNRSLQAVMTDSMDSLRLVRAHGADTIWAQRLGEAFGDTRSIQIAQTKRTSAITSLSAVGLAVAASLLVYIATQMSVPPASIVVILLLVARMARQMQGMTGTAVALANVLPAVRDLTDLTDDARSAVEVSTDAPTRRSGLTGGPTPMVELRDVTYTYPDSASGVHDVSITVDRGRITALTGHSGAGKSTTADIILGLLTPQAGEVIVDGAPLAQQDLTWWRSHIAYVPQDTILIPGSLRENLQWSASRATDKECWQALDRAAARFARSLPQGLDTILGDRGMRLSGGERQRIAIARALVRDPALLVMDEATSSLDDATESQVLELLRSLASRVTVLVIAHRQSTIDLADHVVRFDGGRIIEQMSKPR